MERPKILYIASCMGYPAIGGPKLRTYYIVQALSQLSSLEIFSLKSQNEFGDKEAINEFRKYSNNIYFPSKDWLPTPGRNYSKLEYILRKGLHFLSSFFDCVKMINQGKPDLIWLGFATVNFPYALLSLISRKPIVVDTDSVYSRFILRRLPYTDNIFAKVKVSFQGLLKILEELLFCQFGNVITAVSNVDQDYYRKITGNKPVEFLPNIIDPDNYRSPVIITQKKYSPYLVHTGSMISPPNVDASKWLIFQVMPQVWKEYPDLSLYIVGYGPPKELLEIKNPRVRVTGEVTDITTYIGNAEIALVANRYESGTRFKILEAWACKIPVVSTQLGAEGLDAVNGQNIIIEDDPHKYAHAIISLLQNQGLRASLTEEGYKTVCDKYSVKSVEKEILTILEKIITK